MVPPLVWVILSYLLGSVPFGILLSRLKGLDPRNIGSGNIGATNVMRTAGKTLAIVTLLCDILKGFMPTWLAIHYGQPEGVVAAVSFAAFAGHLFPLYLTFKGGKGVATALGVFLAMSPLAVLIAFIVFSGVLFMTRYVSLGSLAGSALMPLILLWLDAPPGYVIISAIMAVFIFLRHKDNMKRLCQGTEHRIKRTG
ncbi:MAG: glycerol-3-phosphate 1-O-acyltransferase PlsY [Syntrophorhabdales bacterium]|jgi:glycerol-3-phosphate acyltransferase PlsY